VCACDACIRSCHYIPGYLIPADLERIWQYFAPTEDLFTWARQHLLASPGALVTQRGRLFRIPTLVPARQADGTCRFLTAGQRCAIHAVSPYGCAFFDAHQPDTEADHRSSRGLRAVLEAWQRGDTYAQVWYVLHEEGLEAPPPEVCRKRLRQAQDQEKPP
jgi:Fe-S-cluster containining protein